MWTFPNFRLHHVVLIIVAIIFVIIVVVIIAVCCHRPLLCGASILVRTMIATALTSFHIMHDVSSTAIFCNESTECFSGDFQILLQTSCYYTSSPRYYWYEQ